jgi:hypothetical protein
MEVCVQIIDINPAISYLKTNKSDIISLILFDDETSEVIINLDKFIQKKDTLNFVIKNINNNNTIKIKCTLVLNIKDILGVSEFLPKPNGSSRLSFLETHPSIESKTTATSIHDAAYVK